jgi:hypothetical protein
MADPATFDLGVWSKLFQDQAVAFQASLQAQSDAAWKVAQQSPLQPPSDVVPLGDVELITRILADPVLKQQVMALVGAYKPAPAPAK